MNEMPHLNETGTDFFNGSQWAHITRRHLTDAIPAWGYDLIFVVAFLAALIGLTAFFGTV